MYISIYLYDEDDEKKRQIEDEICYDNSRSLRDIHLFYDTTKTISSSI